MTNRQAYIEERSTPVTESGCWLWEQSCHRQGYGQGFADGRQGYAHRIAYEAFVGPIPKGMHVCHKCDVPGCVNPIHLFLGTVNDNMRDRGEKGRTSSKLTEDDVRAIRADTRTQREIAKDYGVCQQEISRIKARLRWNHVE